MALIPSILVQEKNILGCILLQNIISHMSGVQMLESYTHNQIKALCSSPSIIKEAGFYSKIRSNKEMSKRLLKSLCNEKLIAVIFKLLIENLYRLQTQFEAYSTKEYDFGLLSKTIDLVFFVAFFYLHFILLVNFRNIANSGTNCTFKLHYDR